MMNDARNSRFKSYIEDLDLETVPLSNEQRTRLLEGEVVICEAQNVVMFVPLTEPKKGPTGILTVTNFKVSFVCAENEESIGYQQNLLLGHSEICLSSIDAIYQVGERSKKRLMPGHNISMKIKELQLICKNMRVMHFSFKCSNKDSGKNITNAVLHHSTPKRQSLLFAYDYKEPYYKPILKDVQMFKTADDWRRELERTRCKNWRVCSANENFCMSLNLPQVLIVPQSTTDSMIQNAAAHFKSRFGPIWVWGTSKGAALVRMADLEVTITDRTQENMMLEHIRKSHYKRTAPEVMDLIKDCPSLKELQASYLKLRELCCPDNIRLFKTQDSKFYSLLESSKWLQYVSLCLSKAISAASKLKEDLTTVVLQDVNGRDMCCVVSSLTQLLLDPYWRSFRGFQSLVQKDWVILGHPFRNRLGLTDDDESEPAPYFLLFLDCVWQLLQQFPMAFQISEIYLTTLWDSTSVTIFDTFIFNCEHDRDLAQKNNKVIIFRSVWDWNEQFSERDKRYFCNPLYDDSFNEQIVPNASVAFLEIWSQCYFRWCPLLEIRNGGKPQIDLSCRIIAADVCMLNQLMTHGDFSASLNRTKEEMLHMLQKVNGFFPFSHHNGHMQSVLSDNNDLLSVDGIDTQSILNLTND